MATKPNKRKDYATFSRQRRWQIRQVLEGNCQNCGKPREQHEYLCDSCYDKNRTAARVRMLQKYYERQGRPIPKSALARALIRKGA